MRMKVVQKGKKKEMEKKEKGKRPCSNEESKKKRVISSGAANRTPFQTQVDSI